MDMKNQAFIIKAKSEESGGGDGSREADQDDFVVDDGEIQVGGSDIAKRLGGIGTHVAYFYKFMEENGLKAVAYQQLNKEIKGVTFRATMCLQSRTRSRRKVPIVTTILLLRSRPR